MTALLSCALPPSVATIIVRDLDDEVRDRLRVRAAQNGRSMEAEARAILAEAVSPVEAIFVGALLALRDATDGIDLDPYLP